MSEMAEILYGELSDGAFFAPASSDLVDVATVVAPGNKKIKEAIEACDFERRVSA